MRSLILSQCRDLRIGVTREDLGALTTVVHWLHLVAVISALMNGINTNCCTSQSRFTHSHCMQPVVVLLFCVNKVK